MIKFLQANAVSVLVIILFLYFMLGGTCNGRSFFSKKSKTDTVTNTITKFEDQPEVKNPVIQPIIIESRQPIIIPQGYQVIGSQRNDTTYLNSFIDKLTKQLLAMNKYGDSIKLHDSVGNDVGIVKWTAMVQENTMKDFASSYKLRIPHTFTTTTITKEEIRRKVFFGAELQGRPSSVVNQFGLNALYLNKQQMLFGIGGGYDFFAKEPYVKLSGYRLIRLRK